MATHTRYPDIKRWAQATGRRSVQLWMAEETIRALDRLCRARGVGRAQLLDGLIKAAECGRPPLDSAVARQGSDPVPVPRSGTAG